MFKGTSTDDVHVKYCVKWVTRKRHIIVVFNVKCVEAALGYKVTSIEKPCVDPITWSIMQYWCGKTLGTRCNIPRTVCGLNLSWTVTLNISWSLTLNIFFTGAGVGELHDIVDAFCINSGSKEEFLILRSIL